MLVSQTGVFATAVAATTILTIREENSYSRYLSFRNISGSILTIVIEYSATGAAGTWVTDTASFPLADGAVIAKVPTNSTLLRIQASGAAADAGLEINYTRIEADSASGTWLSPQI